jgi:hypothetical protein
VALILGTTLTTAFDFRRSVLSCVALASAENLQPSDFQTVLVEGG